MTGEDLLFLIVVWTLGSVPLSLLMASVFGFGAEHEPAGLEAASQNGTERAA